MDRSLLAARIQEILKARPRPAGAEPAPSRDADEEARSSGNASGARVQQSLSDEESEFAARCARDEATSEAASVFGGRMVDGPAGPCLVVDRDYDASHVHGRDAVAAYARSAGAGLSTLPWFLSAGVGRSAPSEDAGGGERRLPLEAEHRLLFFDLETTGLSGGAGTYAFLVGCGSFDGDGFRTRQFFLRGYGEERALLEAVRAHVQETASSRARGEASPPTASGGAVPAVPCLVTYNGRSFDLPLIETRYLFHRSTSPFSALAHVDMLFAARRLWRRRPTVDGFDANVSFDRGGIASVSDLRSSCALTALEQDVLRLHRRDDVPGWEIPARFFTYARTGDARGLVAVMEHNRLDLLSLAAISAVILEQVLVHDRVTADRHGCLALARLLEYLGRVPDAERCYERAAAPDGLIESEWDRLARAEALHWLALHRRRARRFAEAADAWRGLLHVPGIGPDLRREACEALAIHHEHRAKDLDAARSFALSALDLSRGGRFAPAVEHRLHRLSRKLGAPGPAPGVVHAQRTFPVDE